MNEDYVIIIVVFIQHLHTRTCTYIPPQSNTYQGILITDGVSSYVVFVYHCDLLDPFSVAGIGYYINNTLFKEHPLSNMNRSSAIACENLPQTLWNSVVFPLFGT